MEHTKGKVTIEAPCGFPYSGLYVVPVIRKDFPFHIAKIRQLREHEESEANARRIVLCWNSHDDLLAALQTLAEAAQEITKGTPYLEAETVRAFDIIEKVKTENAQDAPV